MIHILSSEKNTSEILNYDHEHSLDYRLFFDGMSLSGIDTPLLYKINKKSGIEKLPQLHLIRSTGPDLVSAKLRDIIYKIAPKEVEFFDALITYKDQTIEGFSCINPLLKLSCVDMEKSEYEQSNFDPNNPKYMFFYTVLLDHTEPKALVARCSEQPRQFVVDEKIKAACIEEKLSGLTFCRAIDMTYNERTICKKNITHCNIRPSKFISNNKK